MRQQTNLDLRDLDLEVLASQNIQIEQDSWTKMGRHVLILLCCFHGG